MSVGPVGPLAPLPSPTAGMMPVNNFAGLAQAAGQIKQAMDHKKQKAKQDAQQQLPMLIQMAKAQPTNPQVQNSLKAALHTLGLPMPMENAGGIQAQTTPSDASQGSQGASMTAPGPSFQNPALNGGMPGGDRVPASQSQPPGITMPETAQLNKQVNLVNQTPQVDLNALSPMHPPNEGQTQYLMGLPAGKVREAAARTMQVAVDPDFINNAPAMFVPGSPGYVHAHQILQQINTQASMGALTPDQYANALKQNRSMFESAQIDTSETDPVAITGLSRKAMADIDAKIAQGAHYKTSDIVALQNAHTLGELRAAQAKLAEAHAKALPAEEAAKLHFMATRDAVASSRAATYAQRVQVLDQQATSGNKLSVGALKTLLGQSETNMRATQGALDRAMAQRDNLINAQGVSPDDDGLKDLNARIAKMQQDIQQATEVTQSMVKQYSGATGLTTEVQNAGAPIGNKFTPKVDISKATRTATAANGKKYYDIPGMGFVDTQGNKYQP